MNDYVIKHAQLLKRWRSRDLHRGAVFISDGVIDVDRWRAAPRKVHFLLKEAYGDSEVSEDWDLCEVIREEWRGPKYSTWQRASRWAYFAQHGSATNFPSYDEASAGAREALLASSFSNLKKSGGASASEAPDLSVYVEHDQSLIKEQVELIRPDIVICGYTWALVSHLWGGPPECSELVHREDRMLFVDYWHPANRYPGKMNYYALGAALQRAWRAVGE